MYKAKDLCLLLKNKYRRKIFDKSIDVGKSMKKNMVQKY